MPLLPKGGDTEVLPENSPDADSDDSDDSDDSVEEAEFTREDLDAFLRRHGGSLSDAMAQAVCSEYAGFTYMELRMLVLGNTGHDLTEEEWNELIDDDDDDDETEDMPENLQVVINTTDWTRDFQNVSGDAIHDFSVYVNGTTVEIKNDETSAISSAAKIQDAWRKYSIRKDALILYRFSNL